MSQNWDFYFSHFGEKPASLFVDLDIIDDAPLEDLPNMVYLRVVLQQPREDGFCSQEEYDKLAQIEDHLEQTLVEENVVMYVGRVTCDGYRDFFFYTSLDADAWQARVSASMNTFPDYKIEQKWREDPEWDAYFEFLYPDELDMQTIQNRRVCINLQEHGDNIDLPREIDHFAVFYSTGTREQFIEKITELGFGIRHTIDPGEDTEEDDDGYTVEFFRTDVPSAIDDVTLPLFELAAEFEGDYDGWGAPLAQKAVNLVMPEKV